MRVTLSSLGVECDTSQNLQQVMSLISIRNEVFNNEAMYKLILLDLEQKSKDQINMVTQISQHLKNSTQGDQGK